MRAQKIFSLHHPVRDTISNKCELCDKLFNPYLSIITNWLDIFHSFFFLSICIIDMVQSIDWYKDNILIASSVLVSLVPPKRFKMWENGSLEVSDLKNSDTGEYECRVSRSDPSTSMAQLHAIEVMCKYFR